MRLSKMILSSSVGVGGGVQTGMTVTDDAGEDSIEVVIVVPSVVSAIVVVGVRVVGLWGAALPRVTLVFLVAAAFGSSASSGGSFFFRGFKRSLLLRLLLLSWSYRAGYKGR